MQQVIRSTSIALAACALAAPALAVFTGIDLREDKGQIPPAELAAIDPMGLGVRVINLYATFDGPAVVFNDENNAIAVGQPNHLGYWGVNKEGGANASAGFYQDPLAGDLAPNQAIIDLFPSVGWDSYVDLGLKTVTPGDPDASYTDPDFMWIDQDFDGAQDAIAGGWATGNPPAMQGSPIFNSSTGAYEVFLTQLTIVGLDAGAQLGQLRSTRAGRGAGGGLDLTWESDVFSGSFLVFTQRPIGDGAIQHMITFDRIPAPSSALCALPIGALAIRRRRSA